MKTLPLLRMCGRLLSLLMLMLLVLVVNGGPRVAAAPEAPLGAISLSSSYTQNFNTLATSGTTNTWTDDSTLSGWYSNRTVYIADAGLNTTGGLHSHGTGTATERALGSIGSNSVTVVYYGARFTNNTGLSIVSLTVNYTGEQWRNGGNTTQHKLDFAYQVGATVMDITAGAWTDVDSLDFTGPIATSTSAALDGNASANQASLSQTFNVTIAAGQEIMLRWTDVNDSGNDHGLSIDDLTVSATTGTPPDAPPQVSSHSPTAGATGVAVSSNITINFNETVDVTSSGVTLECPAGTPVAFSGLAANDVNSVTLDPSSDLPYNTTCTVTAVATGITDNDGTADQLDGDGNGTGGDNYAFTFTTAAAPTISKIHDVQGSGSIANSGTFAVEAIVIGDFQGVTGVDDFKLDGFFIQEEDADVDGNAATSEGIFVFCDTCPTNVSVGDKVQVTGASSEYYGMSQLSATSAGSVTVISSGNTLPTPASLTLPVPGVTATDLAGATAQIDAYYESFEGMLVKFPTSLSVTEYFELFRYGQVVLAQGGRFRQLTDTSSPSTSGYTAHQIDMARRIVILDDDSNQQNHALMENPDIPVFHPATAGFSTTNYFRGGDAITNLTGVLHYSFAGLTGTDAWRIRPVTAAFSYAFTSGNPRPSAPSVTGNIKVASFNVLNYFTTINVRGANSTAEFTRQSDKIVAAITGLNADVIGLMEIENNGTAIADLVSKLNAVAGAGVYDYINTGVVGSDQITVGIIYKPGKVTPVGAVQTLTATAFTDPNSTGTQRSRPAVAQTFQENVWGEQFTLVVNHLKSKSCSSATGADADQFDGQGCWSDTRQKGATYLVNTWLPSLATSLGDADFLVIGDLNAYRKDTAITNITGAGYTDLVNSYLGASGYGYVFDGQLGYLDHALSSAALTSQVTGLAEWHINADEVNLLDYNDTIQDAGEDSFDAKPTATTLYQANAYRASDHDPVLVGLSLYPDHSTNTAYGDAWHTGSGAPSLGAGWSREASAGGDGADDGLIGFVGLDPNWASGGGYITVDVRGVGASGACAYGWIDWNQNNSFADSGEASTPAFTSADDAALQVAWAAPTVFDGAAPNPRSYNLRLRLVPGACGSHLLAGADAAAQTHAPLGPSANLPPTGGASGGEVEDHTLNFTPTAIHLAGLHAAPTAARPLWLLALAPGLGLALGLAVSRRRPGSGPSSLGRSTRPGAAQPRP